MKNLMILFICITLTYRLTFAQGGSLIVFSQNGERFYVILDGIKQNNAPATNVKVTDLTRPTYRAKIIFEDPAIPPIDKTVYVQDYDTKTYMEVVYNLRRNKNGVMDMRLSSISEISSAPRAGEQNVVKYHAEEIKEPVSVKPAEPAKAGASTTTMQTTTVGTGTSIGTSATIKESDESVTINIDMGGLGTATSVTTTTTTTHTTITKTTDPVAGQPAPKPVAAEHTTVKEAGCTKAISASDFEAGKKSIKSQSFADTQLKVAKTFTKNNCLSVAQIKEIMSLFSFEQNKLEYAKFAYDYCVDKKNYYQLSEAFSFSSSADELNEFLESK
jgi:hypothetical protein